ncbi:periplasmic chaperone for outer membrane proteins Skp [Rhodothermus profundi]|uniref:Periplasmic chaperone for outer membrane proteins Skp n=2 Tax=Rhodothermus profundi TaxID=633813 RepID=A0A1M6PHW7_9BACT|nr:periplasmic chaperone for outer membrane proteins Skp [Rhodothermus profundi]
MGRLWPVLVAGMLCLAGAGQAQHRIGYVDTEYILSKLPEYQAAQQRLDQMVRDWQAELDRRRQEIDRMFEEYQARELLYTPEERRRRREEIARAEEALDRLRQQYFGPEGELFRQQETLLRPIQERVLEAIEAVARDQGYDYVLDKAAAPVLLYAPPEHDLSDRVLAELNVNVDSRN